MAGLALAATDLSSAAAKDGSAFPPPGWHAPIVRVTGGAGTRRGARRLLPSVTGSGPTDYRGLTINRQFDTDVDSDEADVLFDGTTHYGDIRRFNPAPTVTSGTQLPFGLDGIGGYGSDIGYLAGEDSAAYQRQR